jgi:hypothetical protein
MNKLEDDQETDHFQDFFLAKFSAAWSEIEYIRRIAKVNENLPLWWLFNFAADAGINAGSSKEEFMEAMSKSFDEMMELVEEETEDTTPTLPIIDLDVLKSKKNNE